MNQDAFNFQYILYTCRMGYADDTVDYSIRLWPFREPKGFMTSTLPVESFDTDRDVFLGRYRSESNPESVERGRCSNSIALGGTPCGSLHNKIRLAPGEKKYVVYVVGVGDAKTVGQAKKKKYSDRANVDAEFRKVESYWSERMGKYRCQTPSSEVNSMVNIWNQLQCHTTFNWSRSASFNEAGGRDGMGYRDSHQDTLGVVHSIPALVKKKLTDLLKGQYSFGAAMHGIQPLEWKQGKHNITPHIFSDDHLWMLLSVPAYLKETGDMAFLKVKVPFADKGQATVYDHLKKALDFRGASAGLAGFMLGLTADWNDCLNLRGKGESMFSTFLFLHGLNEFDSARQATQEERRRQEVHQDPRHA